MVGDFSTSTASLEFLSRSRRDVMIDIATFFAFFENCCLSRSDVMIDIVTFLCFVEFSILLSFALF